MTREAWVTIPSEETVRAALPPGAKYPYDFGFLPASGFRCSEKLCGPPTACCLVQNEK